MARTKKTCPKPPRVKLLKAKRRKRATMTAPSTNTDEHYMICAATDRECVGEAERRKLRPAKVSAAKPGFAADPAGFTYKSGGAPCAGDRFDERDPDRCPVQTTWVKGEMHLRFCTGKKQVGKVVKLGDDAKATKRAVANACKHWKKHLTWDGYAPLEKAQLGGRRKRKRAVR